MLIFKIYRASIATIAALFVISSALNGQHNNKNTVTGDQVDTTKVYQLGEVVISASRYPESATTAGRNVTVITRQEIDEGMYTNVSEALAHQQSLHMVGNRQTPGSLQQGFLRQANSNHAIVMIDGIRISDPSTVNNSIDLSELSLAGIERIEIVRGSHSTLYGSSAIGGVVNIITRDKSETGLNISLDTKHGTFGSGTYSTVNDVGANYTLDSGWYGNLSLSQHYTKGIDATTDTVTNQNVFNPQDRETFTKIDGNAKVGYKTDKTDLYISYRIEDQKTDVDQGAFNDDDNATVEFNRNLLGVGASHHLSEAFRLQYKGAWSDLDRYFVNDSSLVDNSGSYDGVYTETEARGSLLENELTGVMEFDNIRILGGTSLSRQTMSTRSYVFVSQFNFESETNLDSLNLEEIITSGFIHAEVNGGILSNNLDRFSLIAGTRIARHNRFGTHMTYEINPKFRIGDNGTLYGAVTTGFNAPSLYQLHAPEQGFGVYTNRGNPGLEPETSTSYELGWKQWLDGNNRISLSLYKRDVRDVIEYVYLWNGNVDIENLGFADYRGDTYINLSRQEVQGLELNIQSQIHPQFNVGGGINLSRATHIFRPGDIDAGYTGGHHVQVFESGKFINSEKELDRLSRRPSVTGEIQLHYRPLSGLNIGLNTKYVGERYDVFYSSNLGPFGALDRSELGSYLITDIKASYRLSQQITIGGKIQNLFNESYQELRGFNTTGRAYYLNAKINFRNL